MRFTLPMDKPINKQPARPMDKQAARPVESPSRAGGSRLRRVLLLLLLAFSLGLAAEVYLGYGERGAPFQASPTFTAVAAQKGTLVSSVPVSGSVVPARRADLGFGTRGRLVEISVSVGDAVSAGQLLARLDGGDLEVAVAQAESALRTSKLKLTQLQQGASAEEIAAAEAAAAAARARFIEATAPVPDGELLAARAGVDQALAAQSAAQARLSQMKQGPSGAELAAAQAQVDQARTGLAQAESRLKLLGADPFQLELGGRLAELAAARAKVASAEARLEQLKVLPSQAELTAAQAAADEARAALTSAQDRYHLAVNGDPLVGGGTSVPAVQQALEAATTGYEAAVQRLEQLKAGPSALQLAAGESELQSARQGLAVAAARVEQARSGRDPSELASAQQAVDSARASLSGAEAKLGELRAGPTEADVLSAESALSSAGASLAASRAKLDALSRPKSAEAEAARSSLASAQLQLARLSAGPDAAGSALAEEQVKLAEIELGRAQLGLRGAMLVAPFDGVVASVSRNLGEQLQDSSPVVTVVDPKAIRVDATVGEAEVAKLSAGQVAGINIDAIGVKGLTAKVVSVAATGTRDQKGATYLVSLAAETPAGTTVPAGLSARASIETKRQEDTLMVPNAALRGQGDSRIVQVLAYEGVRERAVVVGSANEQFTEVVSGLVEGEQVVVGTSYAPR